MRLVEKLFFTILVLVIVLYGFNEIQKMVTQKVKDTAVQIRKAGR